MSRKPSRATALRPPLDLQPIRLLRPATQRHGSLMRALQHRRTIREIGGKGLSLQMLSDLLWAAWGINRRKGPFGMPGRTAASASNSQEIDLYVALPEATYRYEPVLHQLVPAVAGDLRHLAINRGQSQLSAQAPARLIFVADIDRLVNSGGFQEPGLHDPDVQRSYYYVATGLIAANVYLFAATAGLAAWFHNCDRARLSARLRLGRKRRVLFAQTVGYPARDARQARHTRRAGW